MSINVWEYDKIWNELSPGETTRVNHEDCTAGEDTKERLYFTRPSDSPALLLAYCHNCQQSRSIPIFKEDTFKPSSYFKDDSPAKKAKQEWDIPTSLELDPAKWGGAAQRWRIDKNLKPAMVKDLNIAWNYGNNSIFIPMYESILLNPETTHEYNSLLGYQERSLNKTKGPKYTTHLKEKGTQLGTVLDNCRWYDRTVVVEDLISGYRVLKAYSNSATFSGTRVLVNYGVNVNLQLLNKANGPYQYVWFDGDNVHVIEQAETHTQLLDMLRNQKFYTPAKNIITDRDPKAYSLEDIKYIIDNG